MIRNYLILCHFGILVCFLTGTGASEAIISGLEAEADQITYQVSVQNQSNHHICGGGIIGECFILTAARCVVDQNDNRIIHESLHVTAGTHDLENSVVNVAVQTVYVSAEYDRTNSRTTGDIAVLKLKNPLRLSARNNLRKLDLGCAQQNYDGVTALISGWGWNSIVQHNLVGPYQGVSDDLLRYAPVIVFNNRRCQDAYRTPAISEKVICASATEHGGRQRAACCYDEGGPLVHRDGTRLRVIGILSKIAPYCLENTKPAIYTRVSSYLQFIDDSVHNRTSPNVRSRVLPH